MNTAGHREELLGRKREGVMQKRMSTRVADVTLIRLSQARLLRVPLAAEVLRKKPGSQLALVMVYVHPHGRRWAPENISPCKTRAIH